MAQLSQCLYGTSSRLDRVVFKTVSNLAEVITATHKTVLYQLNLPTGKITLIIIGTWLGILGAWFGDKMFQN